jgi:hypothetical protein
MHCTIIYYVIDSSYLGVCDVIVTYVVAISIFLSLFIFCHVMSPKCIRTCDDNDTIYVTPTIKLVIVLVS